MIDDSLLDKKIRTALTYEENGMDLSSDVLEKSKQMLKYDDLLNGRLVMKSFFKRKNIKLSLVIAVVLIFLGSAAGVSAATLFRADKIDYPFVDDSQVIGKWQSVDFVNSSEMYDPDQKQYSGDLYLKELAFLKDGKMLASINEGNGALTDTILTWTKGLILNSDDKTASKYEVKDINGSTYMFFEWKSGDYIFRGMQPSFYVLKKADSDDYSDKKIEKRVDNTDYPFTDDTDVLGKWDSVDFVGSIDQFDPEKEYWQSALYLTSLTFEKDGKIISNTNQDKDFSSDLITWTKGLVLNKIDYTASAYTIKEINGSTYMFYEWKSGDYTLRGMDPFYYVLKKEN